jgi:hypothetical protein
VIGRLSRLGRLPTSRLARATGAVAPVAEQTKGHLAGCLSRTEGVRPCLARQTPKPGYLAAEFLLDALHLPFVVWQFIQRLFVLRRRDGSTLGDLVARFRN